MIFIIIMNILFKLLNGLCNWAKWRTMRINLVEHRRCLILQRKESILQTVNENQLVFSDAQAALDIILGLTVIFANLTLRF